MKKFKEFKITNLAVENRTTIYIFTIILVFFGMSQYNSTQKEKFPEIVFPYFAVTSINPGTSPEDMENLFTRPIEKELKGISGVKKINSKSLQDVSSIFIEFEMNANETKAYTDVKEAVDKSMTELPSDRYEDPEVTRIDLSEIPILNINLSGDISLVKLKEIADDLQDKIETLPQITRVDIAGALEREIQINVDLYKMQAAGINYNQIEQLVKYENIIISGGQLDAGDLKRTLRINGEFTDVDQIGNILLKDGIYLKDIAEIKDGFEDRESYARLNGEDVIVLNVIKKSGKNLIVATDEIKEIIKNYLKTAPKNLLISTTGDQSTMTRNNVSDLFNTIILGCLVVVIILMFFMGIDDAMFVAVSIPLSMLIAFIVLPIIGFTLNMVVLMSFILVLGIVVDNSIVVVENIYRHFVSTKDLPILGAAKHGVGEVSTSIFTGTLTTMAPFLPLIFWPGLAGKFMFYLPIVIIITLAASMLVAYIMNPVFAVSFMKYHGDETNKKKPNYKKQLLIILPLIFIATIFYFTGPMIIANFISFGLIIYFFFKYLIMPLVKKFQCCVLPKMINLYKKILHYLLQGFRPYYVLGSTVVLLFFSFYLMTVMPPRIVFFPEGEPNTIYVYLKMPAGTHIDKTNKVSKEIENRVFNILGKNNPDVESVITNVAINAGESVFERTTQEKLGKITINFVEYKFREGRPTHEYLDDLREAMGGFPSAEISVSKEATGPPTGKPVNIEISGDNIDTLVDISLHLYQHIVSLDVKGIEELKTDMEISKPELIINIDREKANRYGITSAQIGMALRTSLYGNEVSKFREGEDEYPIQLRLDKKYRDDIDLLLSQKISPPYNENQIPISTIASPELSSSYGGIIRINQKRVITLSSNVLSGYNANEIVKTLKNKLQDFSFPDGYNFVFTGEQEDQEETGSFLIWALLMAIALIFIILVSQFNSLAKPIIISVQIFFSIIGVLLGFIIFKIDFSIVMSGLGIIAVAGIVVKNAIILIDYIDKQIAKGGDMLEAIVNAGATRLIPVLLTALSTIFGLLPLATGMNINFITLFTELNPNIYFGGDSADFWNSLAWTIIFGLGFATILTLGVVPAMYKIVFVRKSKAK